MKRGKGWAKDDLEGGSRHSDRKSRTTHTTVPESCTDSEDRPSSRHSSRRSSPSNSSRGDEAIEADSQFRKGRRGVSEHGTKRSCSTSRNRRGDVDEFAPRGSSRKSLSDHGISGISHSGDEPIDDADSRVRKGLRSVSDHGYKRESSISRHEAQPTVAEEQDSPKAKGTRSSSDHKRAPSSSRHKSRRGRRHSTSQAEPRENALSPGRHPSRTGQADTTRESTLSPGRHPTRRTLTEKERQDSRRSMRRQISQQRRNSTLTPKKDKPSTGNQETKKMDIDSSPETEDPHSEVKQRVLHDLAIKKLEIENKQLRDELEHARDIIRQLREQQLEQTTQTESDYYSSTRERTITTDLHKKAKKSSRKSSFWSREKAATLVGLDKKKSKAKSDIKEGLLTMSTATATSSYATPCYSELVSDTPKSSKDDSNNSNNNSNNNKSKKPTLAQNVASALEKQMSFRRSITACNSSPLTTSSNHEKRESASCSNSKSMSPGSMEKQASVRRSIVACNSTQLTPPSNHQKRETASRNSRGSKAASPVDTNKQMSVRHSIVASSSAPLTSSSNHEKRETAAMSLGDMQVLMTQAVSLRHVNTYE